MMFLCKTTFAENWFLESCGIWCGDDDRGFAICMAIWNVVYCLRMCMLDYKLQTFFNLVLFQQLCGRDVLWNWFSFLLYVSDWKSMFVERMMFIFNSSCMANFH